MTTAISSLAPTSTDSGECRIRVLPEPLVKKIAAGEVVERPASVVKELVENAMDAGATRIALAIEDGGRQLIRVTDDGCGMSEEELRLAVMSHATSKIILEDDLYAIRSFGFRGEALASISAISRLRIVSRPASAPAGHEIQVSGERIETSRAAGGPPGTTIEVRDLFYNVPARRKFLRSGPTEMGHINEQLCRLALSHPKVGFELTNNGRVTQTLPAGESRLERIGRYYGAELAAALLRVERNERGVHLEVLAAPPAHSRAAPQWQYMFVNGRYIRDRYLQHAIKESYRGLMEPNRHGVVFLFLTLDPRELDVNVHPTKIEVRWADSNLIHSQVLSALRETFQRADIRPALRTDRAAPALNADEQDRLRQEWATSMKAAVPIVPGDPRAEQRLARPFDSPRATARPGADPLETWRALYGEPEKSGGNVNGPSASRPDGERSAQFAGQSGTTSAPSAWPPRAIQMHDLYLVVEEDDGIMIIDQHALHERVMYEDLRRRLANGRLESQRLLLPETLNVTPRQASMLETHADLLQRLGIDVTSFGTDTVAVHAFPTLMKDTPVVPFMRDLLDQLEHAPEMSGPSRTQPSPSRTQPGPVELQRPSVPPAVPPSRGDLQGGEGLRHDGVSTSTEIVIHRILDMMACKAAVKAGDRLAPDEIESLIAQRHLIEKATNCPHGRPTMLRLTKADLNRQFKRT